MDDAAVTWLTDHFNVVYDERLVERSDALSAALHEADALIVRNRTQVTARLLDAGRQLKVIGRLGVGLDNIDLGACESRGIAVIPATGANAQSVAEYVIGASMLLRRGVYGSTSDVAGGLWPRAALSEGRELGSTTLGLIGFGSIGRMTGRLARAIGMRVIAFDPNIPANAGVWSDEQTLRKDLDVILTESDIVSLHVPLTAQTRHLIDDARIASMKRDAILVNTARGGVVDEHAVARALREGRLAGAALDVFEREPLPSGSPLADCPNLILTPHIAGVTRESNQRVSMLVARKVAEALSTPRG
jgi:(S)-sulfolactate dehydrogenase